MLNHDIKPSRTKLHPRRKLRKPEARPNVRRVLQFIADWWPALFTGVAATGLSSFLYLGSFLTFKAGYVGYGLGFLLGGLATNAMPPAIVWGAMRWIK